VRSWVLGHDEIAPAITDVNGCYELEGMPPNADQVEMNSRPVAPASEPFDTVSPPYAPGSVSVTNGSDDQSPAPLIPANVTYAVIDYFAGLVRGGCAGSCLTGSQPPRPDFQFDLGVGMSVGVFVCGAHPELQPPGTDVCRAPDRRVAGVRVALDQGIGPYYTSANTLAVNQSATTDSDAGSVAVFMNVPPGDRQVTLTSEDPSKTLTCTTDIGAGWHTAWAVSGAQNQFHAAVLPGRTNGVFVFCSLE
jgi:hypothetical protein